MSKRHVPFALVAVILLTLILAVLLSYVYRNETLFITALVLLVVLALSLRAIQAINLFRPRRQKPQTNQSKNRLARAVLQKVFTA